MQQEQQALAEAAARQERQRIARELHDIISHGLGVMVLQAGAAEQVLDRDPSKAREALQLIRATGQKAITELGTLVALIRDEQPPGRDPKPTLRDVQRLAATTRSVGLAVTVQTDGQPRDLPASVELNALPRHPRRAHQRAQARAGLHRAGGVAVPPWRAGRRGAR
jgi:signal transduction histidine kinase